MKKICIGVLLSVMLVLLCTFALAAEGWVKEDNHLCFYKNGTKVTGTNTVDGKVYYFSSDGFLLGNQKVQEVNGEYYYLDDNNNINYGWKTISSKRYYFDLDSGKALKGTYWGPQHLIDNHRYLFNGKGELVINDWWANWSYIGPFFYGDENGYALSGYQKIGEDYFYFDDNNASVKGWQLIGDYLHYFKEDHQVGKGYPEVRGWIYDSNESIWYYCSLQDGHRIVNTTITDHEHSYSFNESGALLLTESTIIYLDNDRIRAIDKDGKYITGWQTFDNSTYYFADDDWYQTSLFSGISVTKYDALSNGYYRLTKDGKEDYYLFEKDCKLHVHNLVKTDRIESTIDKPGIEEYWTCTKCEKLFSDEEGKHEIEAPVEIPTLSPILGWNYINNHYYYWDGNKFVTDWKNIDSTWYHFNTDGEMSIGWVKSGGSYYYMNANGTMATGWIEDAGEWYYFNDNGVMCTGWLHSGSDWYYMKPTGAMATGWYNEYGVWYYFRSSGAMATGWIEDSDDWYYFNDDGSMYIGWLQSGNVWYLMKSNGAMATGWYYEGGTWYYFNNSGNMITGWFEDKSSDASSWYWFDDSGAMATGWKEINGQWEMFNTSGVWLYTWDGQ